MANLLFLQRSHMRCGAGAQVSGLPSLLEVMQLVSGQVQGPDSSAAVELTGSSDPLRISARHSLSLQRRTLTVTLEVYNRLPVDVRNAFIRCAQDLQLPRRPVLTRETHALVIPEPRCLSSCSHHAAGVAQSEAELRCVGCWGR